MHCFGGLLNCGNDSGMSAAAADISLQGLYDFWFAGIGIFLQKRDAADDHSGSAIGALECALIKESLLYGMKLTVLFEALNGDDGFSRGVSDGELAGAPRRAIQQNGAGPALAFAAAVFCSSEAKFFAQSKEQSCVGAGNENPAFSVDLRVDWAWVLEAPRDCRRGVQIYFALGRKRTQEQRECVCRACAAHLSCEAMPGTDSGVLNLITRLVFYLGVLPLTKITQ
jgi:hypothetical protein